MSNSSVCGKTLLIREGREKNSQILSSYPEGYSNSFPHSLQSGGAEKHLTMHKTLILLLLTKD